MAAPRTILRLMGLLMPLLLPVCTGSFGLHGQVIYECTEKTEADAIVYVTEDRSEADVLVFSTDWRQDALPESGIWYRTLWRADADLAVWYTPYRSEANLVIAYTPYQAEAGWLKTPDALDPEQLGLPGASGEGKP